VERIEQNRLRGVKRATGNKAKDFLMKKILLGLMAAALVTGSTQTASAQGWSTAGKVLTGLLAFDVVTHAIAPRVAYYPAPAYYAGPQVVYQQAPVAYQPAPVVQYAPVQPAPAAYYSYAQPQVAYTQPSAVYAPAVSPYYYGAYYGGYYPGYWGGYYGPGLRVGFGFGGRGFYGHGRR
jgi:hypothetical protein